MNKMNKWWGVMVCVEDLEKGLKSYCQMFGVESVEEWEGCYSFTFDNGKFYVMGGMNVAPFLILEVKDIKTEIERLKKEGLEVMDPFGVKKGVFAFYKDKSGNQFGLLQPITE